MADRRRASDEIVVEPSFDPDEDAIREAVAILLPSAGGAREDWVPDRHRTHSLCADCYAGLVDVGRAHVDASRNPYPLHESCCSCGRAHKSGLYLDDDRSFDHCAADLGDRRGTP